MKLKEAIKKNKGKVAKIGAANCFFYCDTLSDSTIEYIEDVHPVYLERKVKKIYDSIVDGIIILIEGNESGRYWTVEEFRTKNGIRLEDELAQTKIVEFPYNQNIPSLQRLWKEIAPGNYVAY